MEIPVKPGSYGKVKHWKSIFLDLLNKERICKKCVVSIIIILLLLQLYTVLLLDRVR